MLLPTFQTVICIHICIDIGRLNNYTIVFPFPYSKYSQCFWASEKMDPKSRNPQSPTFHYMISVNIPKIIHYISICHNHSYAINILLISHWYPTDIPLIYHKITILRNVTAKKNAASFHFCLVQSQESHQYELGQARPERLNCGAVQAARHLDVEGDGASVWRDIDCGSLWSKRIIFNR